MESDQTIADWQQQNLDDFRILIMQVEPKVTEAIKWSVPVFSLDGKIVCAMSTFKNHTKYNFFQGAALSDPDKLFNNGLNSKRNRSIDLAQDEYVDTKQLQTLLRAAFDHARTA